MHKTPRHTYQAFSTHIFSQCGLACTEDDENGRPQLINILKSNKTIYLFAVAVNR